MSVNFVWLQLDVPELDVQHSELFAAIDRLMEALNMGHGQDEIGGLIEFLEGYSREHFGTEKQLMEALDYPGTAQHLKEHGRFMSELSAVRVRYDAGEDPAMLAVHVCSELGDWLVEHISRQDRELGRFILQHA